MAKADTDFQTAKHSPLVTEYEPFRLEAIQDGSGFFLVQPGLGPEEDACIRLPTMQAYEVARKIIEAVDGAIAIAEERRNG